MVVRKEKGGNAVPGWVTEALGDVRKQFEAVQKVEVPINWTHKVMKYRTDPW